MARFGVSSSRGGSTQSEELAIKKAYDGLFFRGEKIRISHSDLCYFSGGDIMDEKFPSPTIHTSIEVAKKCGLKQQIASGAMFEGILSDLVYKIIGKVWYEKGKMRLKFLVAVTIDDEITPYAKVVRDGSGYEVWCENQDRVVTCVGQAIILEK